MVFRDLLVVLTPRTRCAVLFGIDLEADIVVPPASEQGAHSDFYAMREKLKELGQQPGRAGVTKIDFPVPTVAEFAKKMEAVKTEAFSSLSRGLFPAIFS
jgi:hypothetical protein